MVLYVENHKEFAKKLLELINKFQKVAGYKINIYQLFFYAAAMNKQK